MKKTKNIIISILALVAVAFGADQTLSKRVLVYDEYFTPLGTKTEKARLIEKVKYDKKNLKYNEVKRWGQFADEDIKKCGSLTIQGIDQNNIVDKVNDWMEQGSECK